MHGIRALLFLFLFLPQLTFSQEIHWGIMGGIPLSDYFRTAYQAPLRTGYGSPTNRYTVGAFVELSLPFQIGVEFSPLYKRFHFTRQTGIATTPSGLIDLLVHAKTTADTWEFPFLLKYHTARRPVGTFLEIGPSLQTLNHVWQTQTTQDFRTGSVQITGTNAPSEAAYRRNLGLAAGGGIEFDVKSVKVSPGVRTTLWRHKSFRSVTAAIGDGLLAAEQEQVEFLLRITFR